VLISAIGWYVPVWCSQACRVFGLLSQSVPMLSPQSYLIDTSHHFNRPVESPQDHVGPHMISPIASYGQCPPPWSALTTPIVLHGLSPVHRVSHEIASRNATPTALVDMAASRDHVCHHVTIAQPRVTHATLSVSHLAVDLGPEVPTLFFSIYFYLIVC